VVREHLGVVLVPSERLDPARSLEMLGRAVRARDLPVRDVAHKHDVGPYLQVRVGTL